MRGQLPALAISGAEPLPRKKWCGLVSQKMRWGLTPRGWLAAAGGMLAVLVGAFLGVHPFLAPMAPVPAEFLVVEGWIPEEAVIKCAEEFRERGYSRVFTVGGPVGGKGEDAPDDDTYAYVAAKKLERAGVPGASIQLAPTRVADRDRTYAAAIALRELFARSAVQPASLNIATLGVHARRTRLLYREAFGSGVAIGIIAIPNHRYVADRWWRYSEGVKEVVSESAAYLYARFIFSPENPGA